MRCLGLLACLLVACDENATSDDTPDQGRPAPAWGAAFDAQDEGAFLSVFGPEPQRIFAVGGQPDAGVAWRYDGAWAGVDLPDGPLLNWVHGAGDVVWMVGNAGRIVRVRGDAFEAVPSPVTRPLWGVWAASADEAWAVGGEARDDGTPAEPVLLHFTQDTWTQVPLPATDRSFRALFKVFGFGPRDVYAVGGQGIILHWDGTQWTQQASGTGEDLISLWGNTPDDLVVVGGRGNGVLARRTDAGWQAQVVVGQPGFNGVWVDASGTAHIAGNRGLCLRVAPGLFEGERENTNTREVLHGIWGTGTGLRITVGGSLDSAPPWTGVVLEDGR